MPCPGAGARVYADNVRKLALCVRQARAEAHIHLHVQAWMQGGWMGG
jgi:hypothetical protein